MSDDVSACLNDIDATSIDVRSMSARVYDCHGGRSDDGDRCVCRTRGRCFADLVEVGLTGIDADKYDVGWRLNASALALSKAPGA